MFDRLPPDVTALIVSRLDETSLPIARLACQSLRDASRRHVRSVIWDGALDELLATGERIGRAYPEARRLVLRGRTDDDVVGYAGALLLAFPEFRAISFERPFGIRLIAAMLPLYIEGPVIVNTDDELCEARRLCDRADSVHLRVRWFRSDADCTAFSHKITRISGVSASIFSWIRNMPPLPSLREVCLVHVEPHIVHALMDMFIMCIRAKVRGAHTVDVFTPSAYTPTVDMLQFARDMSVELGW